MSAPPRFFLSVCVCVKNELPYLADFIEHYLAQGVDHVYIVDNGSTDGGPESLPEYGGGAAFTTQVTVLRDARDMGIFDSDAGGQGHSRLLTENLFMRLRNETEWAIVVDADEFMFGKNGHSLRTYVQSLPADVNRVYVFWNIITPTPLSDTTADDTSSLPIVADTFRLGQNRLRINYDHFGAYRFPLEIQDRRRR